LKVASVFSINLNAPVSGRAETLPELQNPRELHMLQWSQGFAPGSTLHTFSRSKNSTSSETASSMPKRSSLGCTAGT
jgi:hypothetical protein